MKKTRMIYYKLDIACKMLNNSPKYEKTEFTKESTYAEREFKDFTGKMPIYYRKGFRTYDIKIFLFEENNKVYFKLIGVHNCDIQCCGKILAEKEVFSLRKLKRYLGIIVYTNRVAPMYEKKLKMNP